MKTIILTLLYLLLLSVTVKGKKKDEPSSTETTRLGGSGAQEQETETETTTTATTTPTKTTDEGAILVMGDSWASLSGNYLANVCGSSTTRPIQNDAKAGSTAKLWAYSRLGVEVIENAEYEYTHVYLSIGGNDFLKNQCDLSIADKVAANVVNVIKQVVDASHGEAAVGEVAFQEDLKILYFGYAIPSKDVCGGGRTVELFVEQGEIIFDAIRNSDYAEYVTTFDISDMFVTSESSPLSDASYFVDAIHLNEDGYMKLFSSYNVLRFFDCSVVQIAQMATHQAQMDGQLPPIGVIAGAALAVVSAVVLACCCLKRRK